MPPAELLTAPRLAFMLDDPGSEIGQRLLEACQKKLPKADAEDPAKVAACRQAEREKFKADVFVFRKEGGNLRWIVYQRKGTTLSEVYSARVKLADEMASSFKIRAVSGQGVRPVFRARGDVPVEMPSRNEIVLEEPEYGRLVYRAKTGLVGN